MPTLAQLQKIWLLSDTVLYPEAVAFIRRLVEKEGCNPLPASQVNGLFSIAESSRYGELRRFVEHQRDRDWQPSKRDIKTFYTRLEQELTRMERRLAVEFRLTKDEHGRPVSDTDQNEMLALLAREFIQHVIAENGVIAAESGDQYRAKQRAGGQPQQRSGGRDGNQWSNRSRGA
ncbi:MAG TPA: hypothetical protein VJO32_02350 [Ktedonobacteraceae bacterium]|nr:hypothetical protein [Ktedonobacteraceae bacterium]